MSVGAVAAILGALAGWAARDWAWRWGSAAEWATGLLTGGGLLLTARALQLQSADIREQSSELRAQREQAERFQAGFVTAWAEPAPFLRQEWQPAQNPPWHRFVDAYGFSVCYRNDSDRVIHQLRVIFVQPTGVLHEVTIGQVPPGSADRLRVMGETDGQTVWAPDKVWFEFVDYAGRRWRRCGTDPLEKVDSPMAVDGVARSERPGSSVMRSEASAWPPGAHSNWPGPSGPHPWQAD